MSARAPVRGSSLGIGGCFLLQFGGCSVEGGSPASWWCAVQGGGAAAVAEKPSTPPGWCKVYPCADWADGDTDWCCFPRKEMVTGQTCADLTEHALELCTGSVSDVLLQNVAAARPAGRQK